MSCYYSFSVSLEGPNEAVKAALAELKADDDLSVFNAAIEQHDPGHAWIAGGDSCSYSLASDIDNLFAKVAIKHGVDIHAETACDDETSHDFYGPNAIQRCSAFYLDRIKGEVQYLTADDLEALVKFVQGPGVE
jgi:hypothetical protein